ncbi:phosphoribosylanthranilate isomerase [Hymenobacter sp. HMF4947]|uniref:N-(5'-phosphoribosyl)anthranilate isomerase n=1 Tax=Hymenobacter ginkgonis TaxID=2682976 RepID=A0A7K1THQ8_9BACT|nr:phosphoribosylanthranilate isomerase [Hymenobacter ginkgonis]MVN77967.1 phosphoribosylanthranilate isomerase [Hymenobacter ginkgonis]
MLVKICGMREAANLWAVADLNPDFLGFIFYEKSARFVGDSLDPELLRSLPPTLRKVGVFVDMPLPELLATTTRYLLDYVQLHGHESPAYCREAQHHNLRIIKAFSIDEGFDFSTLAAYSSVCDLFLFDTKGAHPGGNGTAFDWQVLAKYHGPTPFLLSGGLGPNNASELLHFHHPQLVGYDFNSQLELAPGLKDVAATKKLLTRLQEQSAT